MTLKKQEHNGDIIKSIESTKKNEVEIEKEIKYCVHIEKNGQVKKKDIDVNSNELTCSFEILFQHNNLK